MAEEKQNADGSVSQVREVDGFELSRAGAYAAPGLQNQQTNGPALPLYQGGGTMSFNINGTGASTTGGSLFSWKNNLPSDIIVTSHVLDVIGTASSTATVSFGQAATATGTSSNMIATQSAAAVATLNGGALSVKVAQNTFIVGAGAVSGPTYSGLFGKIHIQYVYSPSTTQDSK